MLTSLGLAGNLLVALLMCVASVYGSWWLLLTPLAFFINWFGDSLDGRLAYYRKKPRKWFGFCLDIVVDWIGIIAIGLGYYTYVQPEWKIIGFIFVVLYGAEMIISQLRYKVTDKYSIDSGLLGPTEVRIILAILFCMDFFIPARGLICFRSELLTSTKGNGIMNHIFHGYVPYKGDMSGRSHGSLVAFEQGETTGYGIFSLQDRGTMFISPGQQVYEGMIVGENSRDIDMDINPCKKKNVTNMRTSASDEAIRLTPPRILSLEQALEYINDDELVEVTPENIRLRKAILDRTARGRAAKNARK